MLTGVCGLKAFCQHVIPLQPYDVFPGEADSRWTCLLAAVSSEGLLFNAGVLKCLMEKDRTLPHGI